MAKKRAITFADPPQPTKQIALPADPLDRHRECVSSDFEEIRASVMGYIASGDAKLVEVGGTLWDRAVRAQRLNLGLPSEIVAASLQVGPAVPVTKMSGPRSL